MNRIQKQLLKNNDFRNTVHMVLSKRENSSSFVYYIDRRDRIITIDDSFIKFALDNNASGMTRNIEFSSIWQYISGDIVRYIYRELFREVRERRREIEFPFRCDSPHEKRFMRMKMIPLLDGKIGFVSHLIRNERYDTPNRLLDMKSDRNSKQITMCSWCKAIEVNIRGKNEWVDIEKGLEYYEMFETEKIPEVSHGICPECASQFNI